MALSSMMQAKQKASLREQTRKQLAKSERDYRAANYLEQWSRVPKIGAGLTDLPENVARNVAINLTTQAQSMRNLTEAQLAASFNGFTPENMLRIVRLAMPNTCRSKVFTEFAMETAKDSIKYIRPVYSKTVHGGDLHDKHTSNKEGAYTDASMYKDTFNNVNEDSWQRAAYESTEDRYTQELINIPGENGVFTIPVEAEDGANAAVVTGKLVPGYMAIYDGDETKPIATQNKMTGNFFINTGDYADAAVTVATADDGTITITVTGIDDLSNVKAFARFNLEDDFYGDDLGEIELTMADYTFIPRPTAIGVTWSQLAEITLDTSFGISAQETLINYAADVIRMNLDARAFKLAYAVAKSNKDYVVEFDAGYTENANIEWYALNAQTFPCAIETITDNIWNDINRGGVSRMVCGPSAGTYLALVKDLYKPEKKGKAKGIYQFGEFNAIPVFKAPSSIIPTNEILCVWKDSEENEADVAIAFGTLVPFFSTGIIQRKNFYKEAGLASYGDSAVLNRRYLAILKINNLKDLTTEPGGMLKYSRGE